MFTLHTTQGGVHPPQCKEARDFACVSIAPPQRVKIPLNMHIGGPCRPVVAAGDHVYVGTLIGDGQGLYAPIHASISGTVVSTDEEKLPTGQTAPVVRIESDGKMEADPALAAPTYGTREEFIDCVRASGMVGLGGASFPTWFKMRAPEGKRFEVLVVNGMECEPYITSDFRQMMEHAERVVAGVARVVEALGIPEAVIGVEDNKPEAVEKLAAEIEAQGLTGKFMIIRRKRNATFEIKMQPYSRICKPIDFFISPIKQIVALQFLFYINLSYSQNKNRQNQYNEPKEYLSLPHQTLNT